MKYICTLLFVLVLGIRASLGSEIVTIEHPLSTTGLPFLAISAGESYSASSELELSASRGQDEYLRYGESRGSLVCKALGFSSFYSDRTLSSESFRDAKVVAIATADGSVSQATMSALTIPAKVGGGRYVYSPSFFYSIKCTK